MNSNLPTPNDPRTLRLAALFSTSTKTAQSTRIWFLFSSLISICNIVSFHLSIFIALGSSYVLFV